MVQLVSALPGRSGPVSVGSKIYSNIYHCSPTQQQILMTSLEKQEAHLHNNKGNKKFCKGHKKFCEHETLYRCYDTGNCKGERITLKLYWVEAEL